MDDSLRTQCLGAAVGWLPLAVHIYQSESALAQSLLDAQSSLTR